MAPTLWGLVQSTENTNKNKAKFLHIRSLHTNKEIKKQTHTLLDGDT